MFRAALLITRSQKSSPKLHLQGLPVSPGCLIRPCIISTLQYLRLSRSIINDSLVCCSIFLRNSLWPSQVIGSHLAQCQSPRNLLTSARIFPLFTLLVVNAAAAMSWPRQLLLTPQQEVWKADTEAPARSSRVCCQFCELQSTKKGIFASGTPVTFQALKYRSI